MCYEFKCSICGTVIETQQSIKEKKVTPECPKCKSAENVASIITSAYFILNGQGFYSKEAR